MLQISLSQATPLRQPRYIRVDAFDIPERIEMERTHLAGLGLARRQGPDSVSCPSADARDGIAAGFTFDQPFRGHADKALIEEPSGVLNARYERRNL